MSIIDPVVHDRCCHIFSCVSQSPSFFNIEIESRFSTCLTNIFLRNRFHRTCFKCLERDETHQIPLILEIRIVRCFVFCQWTITSFHTLMWNLMNSAFNLTREKDILTFKSLGNRNVSITS